MADYIFTKSIFGCNRLQRKRRRNGVVPTGKGKINGELQHIRKVMKLLQIQNQLELGWQI